MQAARKARSVASFKLLLQRQAAFLVGFEASDTIAFPKGDFYMPSRLKRNQACGQLGIADVEREVTVAGWVHVRRDLGGLIFIELRDQTGRVQLAADPNRNKEVHAELSTLKNEYALIARGGGGGGGAK